MSLLWSRSSGVLLADRTRACHLRSCPAANVGIVGSSGGDPSCDPAESDSIGPRRRVRNTRLTQRCLNPGQAVFFCPYYSLPFCWLAPGQSRYESRLQSRWWFLCQSALYDVSVGTYRGLMKALAGRYTSNTCFFALIARKAFAGIAGYTLMTYLWNSRQTPTAL